MKTAILLFVGALIGLAVPLLCDWVMFGTLTPCRTIQEYNNIIIQECEVR